MSMVSARAVDRVSFMLSLPDKARVDATLVPGKTYYRFATEDSIEDGELSPKDADFDATVADILNSFTSTVEAPGSIEPLRLSVFVNNRKVTPAVINWSSLQRFADRLAAYHDEFVFVQSLIAEAKAGY